MAEPRGIPAFDLHVPVKPLPVSYTPLRNPLPGTPDWAAEDSARRRQNREREERVARELAAAQDEWRQYFDRHYSNRVARAAFDVHQPEAGWDGVVCQVCVEFNGYEDTQSVEWPCTTYAAMKAAADA